MSATLREEPISVRYVMEVTCDHSPCRASARCLCVAGAELAPDASDLPLGWVRVRVTGLVGHDLPLRAVFCPEHAHAATLTVGAAEPLPVAIS